MVSETARNASSALPRRNEPDLADLAAFTLDSAGLVTSWPATVSRMFGQSAGDVAGRHICDVLMTGPGQRDLVNRAMAEVAAGHVHTATVAGGSLGPGRFAVRWEPLDGLGGGALVLAQRAWPQPTPGWLRDAAVLVHVVAALFTIGAFIIHVYMGTAMVRGGFTSIIRGEVSGDWAHMHHRLWYENVRAKAAGKSEVA